MSSDLKVGSISIEQLRDRISQTASQSVSNTKPNSNVQAGHTQESNFDKELEKSLSKEFPATENLKFSAHAKSRLQSRGIELTPDEIVKMQEAVQKMGEKGSRESLILTDKAAFVVSVKNNTVITAVDKDSMKENVFTNIDSTIMI